MLRTTFADEDRVARPDRILQVSADGRFRAVDLSQELNSSSRSAIRNASGKREHLANRHGYASGSIGESALNGPSTGEGVTVRYALTPLTSLALDVSRSRNRFHVAIERNSDIKRDTASHPQSHFR